jgi:dolichol-phosphate mannosyltransferase
MDGRRSHGTGTGWSLSLVIPAYNEAAGIRQAVVEADEALAGLARDYEVLVVDDGSRDNTAQAVAEVAHARPQVRLLRHEKNRGYGAALRTGFEAARFDRVAFTDADCQFHLDDLASLVPLTDQHPLAVGYRADRQDVWVRRFYSWGYNHLVRVLLGTRVRDCDCALKVFRKEALGKLLPQTRGFFVNAEMLTRARQHGYTVAETAVRHRPRVRGESKVSLLDIPRTLRTLLPFWWSQVLFPSSDAGQPQSPRARGPGALRLGYALGLIVVAALLFFSRLGCPLQEPEEPRYAEIARQMLEGGNATVPVLHGLPYYDKPPLLYWLVMSCYQVFGVHDWAARLVPSGAAFLCVLLTYWWGRRLAGARAAFAGSMILCLSARFVYLGRLLTMNSLLCLWVVAALAAAHVAIYGSRLRWHWWLLSAVACALGLLTKGPVALALVLVPVLVYQALDARAARLGVRPWLVYGATAVGLALPWYLILAATDPDFLGYFFWKHNLMRFVAPFDHAKPVWFYLPEVLLGMLPWSLLLIPLVKFLGRHPEAGEARRPAALGFFLLAGLWSLLFYSLAGSKRAGYILPVMPPLALALGCYLDVGLAHLPQMRARALVPQLGSSFAFRLNALLLVGAIGGCFVATNQGTLKPTTGVLLAGVAVLALVFLLSHGRGRRPAVSWAWCGATTFVLLFSALQLALPGYARRFSMRGQTRPLVELAADSQVPVVCYPRGWDSVNFYLRRNDVRVYTPADRRQLIADLRARPRTLAFVKSDHSLNDLLHDLPRSLEFVPRGRRGNVTVGWVRPRLEVPTTIFVER